MQGGLLQKGGVGLEIFCLRKRDLSFRLPLGLTAQSEMKGFCPPKLPLQRKFQKPPSMSCIPGDMLRAPALAFGVKSSPPPPRFKSATLHPSYCHVSIPSFESKASPSSTSAPLTGQGYLLACSSAGPGFS